MRQNYDEALQTADADIANKKQMNFEEMMNQMHSQQQQPKNNNGWQQMGTVTIPYEEAYERERTFQLGYEAQPLPCKHITGLLNSFTVALRERCAKEGLSLQPSRVEPRFGQGMYYVINGEWYSVMHEGNECTWCYLPYGKNTAY